MGRADTLPPPSDEEIEAFKLEIDANRYDFCRLAYIIFPFGEKGHALEDMEPYDWQFEEWAKLSAHLSNPLTRFETYRLIISSGNGAAKTAFGAMTMIMLLYTQRLRARVTANTDPQLKTVVWPEMDLWFRHARFVDVFFEKFGTSIKARNKKLGEAWRIDTVTWSEESPTAISGLHNKGGAVCYCFEEAPGIPANIWQYASGAFTETGTIKIWLAFGNSDDPDSKFEQNMTSPQWNARRIDTRTLTHIDKSQIEAWLIECNGNEDHDDFRVRVRGMPRKSAKDSIIGAENVKAAIARAEKFDVAQVAPLPCKLMCDPAWTGGDETTIWYMQGQYACLLEKFKLDKAAGEDHMLTYSRLCHWERIVKPDAVFVDQGEGTAIYTLARNEGKNWELVAFGSSPNDTAEVKDSEYGNRRAQMYYLGAKWMQGEAVLDVWHEHDPQTRMEWFEQIARQLCWTKGARHKTTGKKMAESKLEIKKRIAQSPDIADGFVLGFAREVVEKNYAGVSGDGQEVGQGAFTMPDHGDPYESMGESVYD